MLRFFVVRLIQGSVTVVVTIALVFLLLRLTPADPAAVLLRDDASPQQVAYVRQLWGLDQPIYVQFWAYLSNLARGDAGNSFQYNYTAGTAGTPAFGLVMSRFPATIQLAGTALILSILVSVPLGVLCAVKKGSWLDHSVMATVLMLGSLPNFLVGLELMLIFGLVLGLLPTGGIGTPQHVILPAVTLAIPFSVILTRLTATEVSRVMSADYITTAHSKGLPVGTVMWRHVMRNAALPLVTVIGLRLGSLLNGSVVVETVFGWPGIGRLMIESIGARDYPIIQVIVPFSALMFVASNLIVDLVYAWIDPRVRLTS